MPDGGELILTTRREGDLGRPRRDRHRLRDDRGGPLPGLRRLLLDAARRERPGPAHHPQDRRGPRRHDRRAERAGQGLAIHHPAARRRPGPIGSEAESTDGPADPRPGGRRRRAPRRGGGREPRARRLRVRRRDQRARGAAADRGADLRHRPHRPDHGRRRRPGDPAQGQAGAARRRGRHPHRPRHDQDGRHGDAGRRHAST